MANCRNCGAEVDPDQKSCAWCGAENPATGGAATQPKKHAPAPVKPPPQQSESGSEMRVHKGSGPAIEDARKLAQMGDLDGSLSLFNRILESHPDSQEALFGIGGVYFKKGDARKAVEAWLKLKVLNPSYPNLESWIQQAQQKMPKRPPKKAESSPRIEPPTHREMEGEDWRRQSVRVSGDIDERQIEEALAPQRVEEPPQAEEPGEAVDDGMARPKPWVAPVGWALIAVYCVLIWFFYFSTFLR